MATRRLVYALAFVAIALVGVSCGSNDETEALRREVEELQSQLEAQPRSSTTSNSEGVTTPSIGTTTTSTQPPTTTTIDILDPALARERFENVLGALEESTLSLVASDPTGIVPYSSEQCSNQKQYGPPGDDWVVEWLCNNHELTFFVSDSWEYDIWESGSILSPYSATTDIPFSFTRRVIDEYGFEIPGHTSTQNNVWLLSWEYQDGEWSISRVDSLHGWEDIGRALIVEGIALSQSLLLMGAEG